MTKTGEYVEMNARNMDQGRFIAAQDQVIAHAFEKFCEYQDKTSDFKSKAQISIKLTMKRDDDGFVRLEYEVAHKTPTEQKSTTVRSGGGRMLLDQDTLGAGLNDEDQLQMFNKQGDPTHAIDPSTGEVIEPEPGTVGKIQAS